MDETMIDYQINLNLDEVTFDLEIIGTWLEENRAQIAGATSQDSNYDSALGLFTAFSGYQSAADDNNVLIAEDMIRLTELINVLVDTDLSISESL
jgi:hypothetical protein